MIIERYYYSTFSVCLGQRLSKKNFGFYVKILGFIGQNLTKFDQILGLLSQNFGFCMVEILVIYVQICPDFLGFSVSKFVPILGF